MPAKTLCLFLCTVFFDPASSQTIGLITHQQGAAEGYTLFAPLASTTTYLIDNKGHLIHSWQSAYTPGNSVYLLPDGHLLRTATLGQDKNPVFTAGGRGGRIEKIAWDGSLVWSYEYCSDYFCHHHDIEVLPNGNILLIAWERKTREEVIAAGRNPNRLKDDELWPDHVIEIKPEGNTNGTIVWEWHLWDHLIQDFDASKDNYGTVAAHSELVDINFQAQVGADWNHLNAIHYHPELDQIMLSSRTFSEIWIIDHSTTTEEAAGHTGGRYAKGGDLLYRWGNPHAYRGGTRQDQQLFGQHNTQWIPSALPGENNILLFNNGDSRIGLKYSSIEELVTPLQADGTYTQPQPFQAYLPEEPVWHYQADEPQTFYSHHISGVQRLANGNTLICEGASGTLFEVTPDKELVWLYINPVTGNGIAQQGTPVSELKNNSVFRAWRYSPDYPAFEEQTLITGDPIEQYENTGVDNGPTAPQTFTLLQNYPNPFNAQTRIEFTLDKPQRIELDIVNALGQNIKNLLSEWKDEGKHTLHWNGCDERGKCVQSGVYFYRLSSKAGMQSEKMILIR
ncbi:T9SS type A sorting domain-containing protein [candidate division KSB1 bacterium]|nr:T9SS type A sorting domain-containing protein [candidate division KSB1 bacterium]